MICPIKDYRQKLHMTQKELANFLKVSLNCVARWEMSDRTPPKHVIDYLELVIKQRERE